VKVLISFREWLHSYKATLDQLTNLLASSSHLFQRVASFLQIVGVQSIDAAYEMFSSLSESGFIPTKDEEEIGRILYQEVLISFREWLHSYSRLPRLFIHAPSGT